MELINLLNLNIETNVFYIIGNPDNINVSCIVQVPDGSNIENRNDEDIETDISIINDQMYMSFSIPNNPSAINIECIFSKKELEDNETANLLKELIENKSIPLILFNTLTKQKTILRINDEYSSLLNTWVNTDEIHPSVSLELNYLSPQWNNEMFWFDAKIPHDVFETLLPPKVTKLCLNADIFEGELAVYLANGDNLIAVTQIPDSHLNKEVQDAFTLLINSSTVNLTLYSEYNDLKEIYTLPISETFIKRINNHIFLDEEAFQSQCDSLIESF